jgi:hypothetical protein
MMGIIRPTGVAREDCCGRTRCDDTLIASADTQLFLPSRLPFVSESAFAANATVLAAACWILLWLTMLGL